jgi:HSP20 family molecular chaperone IbpA
MNERIKVMPCACFSHDDQGGRLRIDMELPGVDKKDISLEMRKDSFCVSAPRGEDTDY